MHGLYKKITFLRLTLPSPPLLSTTEASPSNIWQELSAWLPTRECLISKYINIQELEVSQQRSLVLPKLLCYKGDRFYIHGGRGHTMRKWPSLIFLSLLLISANRNTETLCLKGCRSVVSCRETYFAAVGLWLFLYITISIVNFKHWRCSSG